MKNISAVIITKNEEKIIGLCLSRLSFAKEVIVIDSGSEDNTVKTAKKYGAKVFYKKWQGYAKQKNFGISKAKGEWILSVDADEIVTKELGAEIVQAVKQSHLRQGFHLRQDSSGQAGGQAKDQMRGYYIPVKNNYYGKFLKFGGQYPDYHLRLFRKGKGKFTETEVHEGIEVKGAKAKLKNPIMHYTCATVEEHIERINYYTDLEAEKAIKNRYAPTGYSVIIRPGVIFFKNYFLKLGFLDGMEGLIHHVISARYLFIKEAKIMEKKGINKFRLLQTLFKKLR